MSSLSIIPVTNTGLKISVHGYVRQHDAGFDVGFDVEILLIGLTCNHLDRGFE